MALPLAAGVVPMTWAERNYAHEPQLAMSRCLAIGTADARVNPAIEIR